MRTLYYGLGALAVLASMTFGVLALLWGIHSFVRYQDGIKGEVTALQCTVHGSGRGQHSDCTGRFTAAGGLTIPRVTFEGGGAWAAGDHQPASVSGPDATTATLSRTVWVYLAGGIALMGAFTGGPVVAGISNLAGVMYYRKKERSKPGYDPQVKTPFWDRRPGKHERRLGG